MCGVIVVGEKNIVDSDGYYIYVGLGNVVALIDKVFNYSATVRKNTYVTFDIRNERLIPVNAFS